jgi:hypothetical protein
MCVCLYTDGKTHQWDGVMFMIEMWIMVQYLNYTVYIIIML